MRVMVIIKANEDSEAGVMPSELFIRVRGRMPLMNGTWNSIRRL